MPCNHLALLWQADACFIYRTAYSEVSSSLDTSDPWKVNDVLPMFGSTQSPILAALKRSLDR
jgi:hypothetical protein